MKPITLNDLLLMPKIDLAKIVFNLLEDKYETDIVDTQMEKLKIGYGNDYTDKRDWQHSVLMEMIDCNHQ